MNIKKVEKSAKKITQLLENIKEEGSVSRIEKDLLLSYIRDMYEKVMDVSESKSPKFSNTPTYQKSNDIPKTGTKKNSTPAPTYIEDVVRREVQSSPEPVRETVVQEIKKEVPSSITEQNNAPVSTPNYTAPIQTATETLVEKVASTPSAPTQLLDLFSENAVSELSDRLSMSPIADLTKSMGINEKIFTIQELFGGDSSLFSNAMQELDKLSSLEQARDYLVTHVAIDQDWSSESKIKKAANFIKLISRRY